VTTVVLIVIAVELLGVLELLRRLIGVAKGSGYVSWHDHLIDLVNRAREGTL
jgi:hypothetical protein